MAAWLPPRGEPPTSADVGIAGHWRNPWPGPTAVWWGLNPPPPWQRLSDRNPDLLESRRQAGRSPQPIAIAVSRSCRLAPDMAFFRQPLERWLLRMDPSLTSPGPAVPAGFSRIESHPDLSQGLTHLAAMGLEKLAVLGGARLASALVQEDLVDELQLTVCPLLLGGGTAGCRRR